ncbi:hypothetical protein J6590_001889 [Homalodisca vitripennis]|nr:hypothetical protein J6590_001889 [Homalodisca vitripennis]
MVGCRQLFRSVKLGDSHFPISSNPFLGRQCSTASTRTDECYCQSVIIPGALALVYLPFRRPGRVRGTWPRVSKSEQKMNESALNRSDGVEEEGAGGQMFPRGRQGQECPAKSVSRIWIRASRARVAPQVLRENRHPSLTSNVPSVASSGDYHLPGETPGAHYALYNGPVGIHRQVLFAVRRRLLRRL